MPTEIAQDTASLSSAPPPDPCTDLSQPRIPHSQQHRVTTPKADKDRLTTSNPTRHIIESPPLFFRAFSRNFLEPTITIREIIHLCYVRRSNNHRVVIDHVRTYESDAHTRPHDGIHPLVIISQYQAINWKRASDSVNLPQQYRSISAILRRSLHG